MLEIGEVDDVLLLDVAPLSVMPDYPWFFEDDGMTPNAAGLSIIAYVQWLGSWEPKIRETLYEEITTPERVRLHRRVA